MNCELQQGSDLEFERAYQIFHKHTDLQLWRPKMFQNIYDLYFVKVGNDIWSIFEFGFTSLVPTSGPILQRIFLGILSPLIVVPLILPAVAFALPFIGLRHFTANLIPALAFDVILKPLLLCSFVLQHPTQALRMIVRKTQTILRRRGPSDSSTDRAKYPGNNN